MPTWNPEQYLRFGDERTRPCQELASRIDVSPVRTVIDLGCGPGNSTSILRGLWPDAQITGLDSSREMIDAARAAMPEGRWVVGGIAEWAAGVSKRAAGAADEAGSDGQFDVVFSNAAMQWVDHHEEVYPKLLERVAEGGALAIQVPGNHDGPQHRLMREIAESPEWRDSFGSRKVREWHVHDLDFYYDVLASRAARIDPWETIYMHVMAGPESIVEWYKGTGLRPFLEALNDEAARDRFCTAYLEGLREIYPRRSDGRVLFPFHRLFLVAHKS
jgi:trans-aconitate 2-methyltransferase